MPDPTFRIRFSSIFRKKAWITLWKTDPDPIWMAWSRFGQTHLVWKQAGVQKSSGPVSGRTQPARYQFPTFRLCFVLPQTSRIILCKTSPDRNVRYGVVGLYVVQRSVSCYGVQWYIIMQWYATQRYVV